MKTTNSLLLATLFAAGATLANAQYVSDGPFGPVAQSAQRSNLEKQMVAPSERAMNKVDTQITTNKNEAVRAQKVVEQARHDTLKQPDTAR